MPKETKLTLDNKTFSLPIIEGTIGDRAVDISALRRTAGILTYDPGFANTASCKSAITFLDGEKGILRYRGIPIEDLAEKSNFVETAYLLIYGELPTADQLHNFSHSFTIHSNLHEDMKAFFVGYPATGEPMAMLSAMVCALSAYYPELTKINPTPEEINTCAVQLLSKVRTIVACTYKKTIGEPFIYARDEYDYVSNFLHMMFSTPSREYKVDPVVRDALKVLLILHADHEQNCSTSTVRLVGSAWTNLYASVSAGICALWGPLHGGANHQVIDMLSMIQRDGGGIQKYIDLAKDPKVKFRLMGFGHRIYKSYDPRAKIIKKQCDRLLKKLGIHDPLLELAVRLEEKVLKDDYFIERKLYPNVDFYSGIMYKAMGIPANMFPAMFAIGRMPGWIAHWKEMIEDPVTKIGRPRQIYIGQNKRAYTPIQKRTQ